MTRMLGVVAALALASGATTAFESSPATTGADRTTYRHVFVFMLENAGYRSLIGDLAAPWINRAVTTYGVATNYYGVAHPSQPNYIEALRYE